MPWIKIGPPTEPKIEFNEGGGGPNIHAFLPLDVTEVMKQTDVNAFQIVRVKLIADQFTNLTNDEYCYALIGVEVEGPHNIITRQMTGEGKIVALPCPPFFDEDGVEIV